jgi:predicted GNAT family N-acyltransferase
MVCTNSEYRGQKICQTSIKYIINLSKKYIKKYELEVDINNIPSLKSYENVGFKKIKENNLKGKKYYLMRLKIDKN